MQTSQTWKPTNKSISIYLYINALGVLGAGGIGLINGRISFIRGAIFVLSLFISYCFYFLAHKTQSENGNAGWWDFSTRTNLEFIVFSILSIIFIAGWTIVWTKLDIFGDLYYYLLAAYPYIIWLTITSIGCIVLLLANKYGINFQQFKNNCKIHKISFQVAGIFLIIALITAWLASFRVVGVSPIDEDFWSGAGVPVFAFQVFWSLILGFCLSYINIKLVARFPLFRKFNIYFLFFAIWIISAFFWAREPVKPDFLVTQPVAPNFEMYPDYDARIYDLMSQFAIIGQGINNHNFFDRVLYPAFLVYLHTLAGQNYSQLMAIQAALFAVLPALLFLIASSIFNRTTGLVLGILSALRGITQISLGSIIETAHQKQMLTEYPTAILLVLITFLIMQWMMHPYKRWWLAGIIGGIIGLSTLLRPHTLIIIPLFFVLAFFSYRFKTKLWIGICTLFIASMLISIIPWTQFSGQNISIIDLYFTRIKDVIKQRYYQNNTSVDKYFSREIAGLNSYSAIPTTDNKATTPNKGVLTFALDNFLNNLVTTVQILPITPFNTEPRNVVKKVENFWKPYWDGSLSNWAKILITLNLLILGIGIGNSYRRVKLIGLIPLTIMVFYYFVNAFGRTSGGRYIVPVDWVILIYYVMGLLTIFELFNNLFLSQKIHTFEQTEDRFIDSNWRRYTLLVFIFSLSAGSLIPIAQQLNPERYPKTSLLAQAATMASFSNGRTDLNYTNLQNFLLTTDAVVLSGRALYPRQMNFNEGLDISVYKYYHPMPFPRTLFTLIGQQGEDVIILPSTTPALIANGSDVMIAGCKVKGFVIAQVVIQLDNKNIFEDINSAAPLSCPVTLPVCDSNKKCN